jgi:hypothetical protein
MDPSYFVEIHLRKKQDPNRLVCVPDPRIRSPTGMSRIHNTVRVYIRPCTRVFSLAYVYSNYLIQEGATLIIGGQRASIFRLFTVPLSRSYPTRTSEVAFVVDGG